MTSEIEIRAYRAGDEHGLINLFGRCFGRQISLEHWQWKMKSCSADYETIWIATHGERLVGQYVGAPVTSWISGQRKPAIAIFDIMVDPEMRREGVLTRLGQIAHDHWREAGVAFGYGLPNQQWGSRAAALGSVSLFPLKWLIRILRPESVLSRRLNIDSLAKLKSAGNTLRHILGSACASPNVRVQEINETQPELDEVASLARRSESIQIARGSTWVDRRYLECPSADYHALLAMRETKPIGYAVYRLRGLPSMQAIITEVTTSASDEEAYFTLMVEIERRCLESGADTIRVLSVPGTTSYGLLRKCGFLPMRAAFTLQYVPLDPAVRDHTEPEHWHFDGGDFDVV